MRLEHIRIAQVKQSVSSVARQTRLMVFIVMEVSRTKMAWLAHLGTIVPWEQSMQSSFHVPQVPMVCHQEEKHKKLLASLAQLGITANLRLRQRSQRSYMHDIMVMDRLTGINLIHTYVHS